MHCSGKSRGLGNYSQLVDEYRGVLHSVSALLALGAPDTLLPATKEEIRLALKNAAQRAHGESFVVEELRGAYTALANFLPYEAAEAAARLREALRRGDQSFVSSTAATCIMARARRIEKEALALGREFDEAVKSFRPEAFLSEVDAFMAEMRRKLETAG